MRLLVLLCIAITTGSPSFAQDTGPKPEKKLTEIQKLKAENFKLKVELTKTRATLQDRENRLLSIELTNDQQKLIDEYRKELEADEKAEFDWDTLTFKLPVPDKK